MQMLDGKKLSEKIKNEIAKKITDNPNKKLVVIKVGNDSASNIYVAGKEKACAEVGLKFQKIEFQEATTEQLIETISSLNDDKETTGIIVQLPLPQNIDSRKVLDAITPIKDVDGLSTYNIGGLQTNTCYHQPCTPKGVMKLLKEYNINIVGKHVVIIGRSNLVGRPLAQLFLNEEATVTICHSKTINLADFTKQADILVSAVGKKHLITKDMVKADSIIIDVGISREDNKIYGDVDFDNVKNIISYITPVPGGVGPMTISMLLENTIN